MGPCTVVALFVSGVVLMICEPGAKAGGHQENKYKLITCFFVAKGWFVGNSTFSRSTLVESLNQVEHQCL